MMRLLVTGGAGFIGSNFIRYLLSQSREFKVINLDKLTYAGNLENLAGLPGEPHHHFIKGDIADAPKVFQILKGGVDAVVNFAAESHVDRSILNSHPFIRSNVLGTQVLLEGVRRFKVSRFLHISTDEVYGPVLEGAVDESAPLNPTSPYAASKGAADLLVCSYSRTYEIPAMIARPSNNYGPYQHPEKFIPLFITNALSDLPLPIYGDGGNIRDWLHVEDCCRAIALILLSGTIGEIYNIGGGCLKSNLKVAQAILERLDKPPSLLKFVADRPGHDRRYSMDFGKMVRELNWRPLIDFNDGLAATIKWYIDNKEWWIKIKKGEYKGYYRRQYIEREGKV